MNISKTTLEHCLKKGLFKKFNSCVKPVLMSSNRITCVNFCHAHVDETTGVFDSMCQTTHVDEKWFCMRKQQQRMHPTEGKCDKEDSVPVHKGHKQHGIEVMSLCAVARPQWDQNTLGR